MLGLSRKKLTIEVPDGKAHILDPMGNRTEEWIVGEHIEQKTYDRLKDATGDLYVVAFYEKGERVVNVCDRETWQRFKAAT
jgi:hypothetical protein